MYQYQDCGLENIWLQNGYEEHDTPYGKAISIQDIDGLHHAIAMSLIEYTPQLSGVEFRFLRKELGMSQKSIAQMFDYDAQSVALWEKEDKVPLLADRTIRALYKEHSGGNAHLTEMIDRLNFLDRVVNEKIVLQETDNGWKTKVVDQPEAEPC